MILCVGYGNSIRSDDGVGIYVADELAKRNLPDVEVRTTHQLGLELLDELGRYKQTIFIDASSEGPEFQVRKVEPQKASEVPSSHHLSPDALVKLAQLIYSEHLEIYVATVRGEKFDFGFDLSGEVKTRATKLVDELISLLSKGCCHA